ncbi:MAG: hypothetical protein M0R75_04465 [Dehalococcoidia bacterium]|nr:hypothetical protein [Dehalococcoidia bacterium]
MVGLLILLVLLALLFGGLGVMASPLFFLLLAVVLIIGLGGGVYGRGRW